MPEPNTEEQRTEGETGDRGGQGLEVSLWMDLLDMGQDWDLFGIWVLFQEAGLVQTQS